MADGYDVIVVGAGHAGCEAALACARMGARTLLLTLSLDSIALMPCNPSIGGTAKGHLVRELDALGGEMGLAIDETFLQSRMLNTGKGPAVRSLRAQADKRAYMRRMRRALDEQPNLTLKQGEAADILVENGRVAGLVTSTGRRVACRALVVACGVYLKSRIIIGERAWEGGPQGLIAATLLTDSLKRLGFSILRFKTGTPARLDGRTIDFGSMERQEGDEPVEPFSFMTDARLKNRGLCYLTYTSLRTREIILNNLSRAPMYRGDIRGTGARYCPSIEDKIVRFADKERHPVFMEPEGADTVEWYAQGMSTSMPEDVQLEIYKSVPGLERAEIMRLAYAIEYDLIDPTALDCSLGARAIAGLYFAGQVNGTSGYEEAAAQGIVAGMNAALWLQGKPALALRRDNSYIGVLLDDLTVKGVDEPYRMMTSRAEYRLTLRQDNADLRLTDMGYAAGLASRERLERMLAKRRATDELIARLAGKPAAALRRPEATIAEALEIAPDIAGYPRAALEQAEIMIKYEGYLDRQRRQIEKFAREEERALPSDVDYMKLEALRIEARQKLNARRPASIGQAARIPGVSPGDVAVLMVYLSKLERARAEGENA